MVKAPPKPKPKSKASSQKPDVYAAREASKREVGDMADKITRALKNR